MEEGGVVGVEFDPMLAKIIAHAPTRREAALKLALALERTRIGGLSTNRDFLVATLRHPAFLEGDTTTDFIERHRPDRTRLASEEDQFAAAVAAAMWQSARNRAGAAVLGTMPSGWRNSVMPPQRFELGPEPGSTLQYASGRDGRVAVTLGARSAVVRVLRVDGAQVEFELDGRRLNVAVAPAGNGYMVDLPTGTFEVVRAERFPRPDSAGPAGGLVAPMPGKIIDVRAVVGQTVTRGQVLVVMEAMKMEHHLSAVADGTVVEVRVSVGQQVDNAAVLLVLGEG